MLLWLIPLPTDDLSAVERWAVFLAALAAGLGAVAYLVRTLRRAYCRIRDWVRRGLERADALERLVQHELNPNSGQSLHDTVHRLDEVVAENSERLDAVEGSLSTMAESQRHMWPAIEAVARAEPPPGIPERQDLQ